MSVFGQTTALEKGGIRVKLLANSVATKERESLAWRGKERGREGPPRALLERALWVFNEAFLLCKPNCTAAWGSRVF